MNINDEVIQGPGTRWLEGLILLVLLVVLIVFSANKTSVSMAIYDEPVSAWSGSVDNLK